MSEIELTELRNKAERMRKTEQMAEKNPVMDARKYRLLAEEMEERISRAERNLRRQDWNQD